MDGTHVHLLLNHFPIIGTLIGTLLLIYSFLKKEIKIQQISLAIIFVMAALAIPVFLTGETAEEAVENLPGVMESVIHEHEEASEVAFWVMMATGLLALISIGMQMLETGFAKTLKIITLILSIVSSGLMARAGYLGGQIRHTEITGNQTAVQNTEQGGEEDND
ncbi:MAG: hypothetical protein IPP29_02355 [Bacteroidetes bacterium]|nr:hypothetical protein [Bacteroidota bacterium]